MELIGTQDITPLSLSRMTPLAVDQIYNALDCCVTYEVHEALQALTNDDPTIYRFERALQGPVLEMMLRGVKIDALDRAASIQETRETLKRLDSVLQRYAYAVWGKPLNPRSTLQLQNFFYNAMHLPQVWTSKKGKRSLSMDREALEKIEAYFQAMPIVAVVLAIRDHAKRLEVFETQIDPDGRYRTSFNIAGTETGRFSSSKSQTGTGGNSQNISPKQRRMFISDPGYRLYGIDLEQAESREVGWNIGVQFDEWAYYDACQAGDLHTTVTRMVWPNALPWTGDAGKDKALAERPFYRHYSYRDMSKRGGHGCLTADHEVLTPSGWVPITTKPSIIMSWTHPEGPAVGALQWANVTHWTDFLHTGEMIEWNCQHLSAHMTPEHRVPVMKRKTMRETKAFAGPPAHMPTAGQYSLGLDSAPGDLLACIHALAWVSSKTGYAKELTFRMTSDTQLREVKCILKAHGLPWSREDPFYYKRGGGALVVPWPPGRPFPPLFPGMDQLSWSPESVELYFQTYMTIRPFVMQGKIFCARNEVEARWLSTLLHCHGKSSRVFCNRRDGSWYVSQSSKIHVSGHNISETKIIGGPPVRVLCPTVPSQFFMIRRKGSISITGNSNYYGQPPTMARHLKVPVGIMVGFQRSYFDAFPGIPKGHAWVSTEIQTTGSLTTKFGRQRHFFGRTNDDTTLREAIAFDPQSCTADRTNLILWRLWKYMGTKIQILLQEHDAIYFQAPEELDPEAVAAEALSHFSIPFHHPSGRSLIVPGECKVGWNRAVFVGPKDQEWAKANSRPIPQLNLNGLKKLKGPETRVRQTGLDRTL